MGTAARPHSHVKVGLPMHDHDPTIIKGRGVQIEHPFAFTIGNYGQEMDEFRLGNSRAIIPRPITSMELIIKTNCTSTHDMQKRLQRVQYQCHSYFGSMIP